MGLIDLTGEMIVEPQFAEAQSVRKEGIAYVKNADGYWDIEMYVAVQPKHH